ncbi:hypothetical protein HD553DRAFT_313006 [Filobasidium floriforme]|uniref:uncharacterized protein n=1 Tax=Filobasidium floriforme TaxID=5210 RepID=UPI001E8E6632|nr:uncharacterized protein HD553DRAFT_313006 [Filobasidium floriforme]KAH8083716.1 hypothetical protein HD553DRAFT_313006 [Filobasidium floriforme]
MNHHGDPSRNWFNNGIPCRFKYENNKILAIFGFEDIDRKVPRVAIWVTALSESMSPVRVVLDRGDRGEGGDSFVDDESSKCDTMVMTGKDVRSLNGYQLDYARSTAHIDAKSLHTWCATKGFKSKLNEEMLKGIEMSMIQEHGPIPLGPKSKAKQEQGKARGGGNDQNTLRGSSLDETVPSRLDTSNHSSQSSDPSVESLQTAATG